MFDLPPEMHNGLLALVNDNRVPSSLLASNVYFYPAKKDYISPIAYHKVRRRGKLRALFTESSSKSVDLIEIQFIFDVKAHSFEPGKYHFQSVNHEIIKLESIRLII